MSTRNIRKFVGGNVLPPPDSDDSDYEPLYATSKKVTKNPTVNPFEGLCPSSDSEQEKGREDNEESDEEIKLDKKTKRKNLKRKKQQKMRGSKVFEMDEIDQSVKEINDLLGAPPPAPEPVVEEAKSIQDILFGINYKNLNPSYELRRLLGPDLEEEARNRKRGRHYSINKRGLVIPVEEKFRRVGLTMSMLTAEKVDGCSFFSIDHDETYRKHHKMFLSIIVTARDDFPDLNVNEAVEFMHVEKILQITDILFAMEEYDRAKKLIEKVVAYLLFISHPLFRMCDRSVRLEYKILENRVYHVAMLKYIYVLTNSACHRTALELSKVLLNIDPTDPLAMIMLVDMLALRAREHQWLVDLVEYWRNTRGADYMFNLLYSYALAKFHVIKKQKGDMAEADAALHFAMKRFPSVVPELFKVTNNKNQQIDNCEMFQDKQNMSRSVKLLWNDLLKYYTLFTASKWREPEVWTWFSKNAVVMTQQYDNDEEIQKYVKTFASQRATFLRRLPQQVVRHFQVIKFMNNFVFDEVIFTMRPGVASYNPEPWPTEDINRYKYRFTPQLQMNQHTFGLFGDLVRSLAPEFVAVPQVIHEQQDEAAGGHEENGEGEAR
ncbi:ribosome quality control complex subunit TCF25-like isoform X2 [Plodia interpunctella]|uniref:ribosome quality control complex subunit TCF25-like isoform X2 n=1 Tax=Plodia interpunctella TaxID=58824 RepID=UPI0023675F7E|nr:transcription factor 25-like isoform X2 [Plodia interpunctella]XP_053623817.1 transcription factor 25-like isoform X2 [Plodia interpunctella]